MLKTVAVSSSLLLAMPGTALAHHKDDHLQDPGHTPITICHGTGNGYIEITIDENGLNGHLNSNHELGSLTDIVPAPAGGCPSTTPSITTVTTETTATEDAATTVDSQSTEEAVTEVASSGSQTAAAGSPATQASAVSPEGELPFTGFLLWPVALLGLACIWAGRKLWKVDVNG